MPKIKINTQESVTGRLGFKPFKKYNNLCLGYLTGVEITTSEIEEDSKWEYAGKTVPRLAFHFEQFKEDSSSPDRFYTRTEMLIASVNSKGEPIAEDNLTGMYTELWKRIKHLHDQFAKAPNYKPIDFEVEFEPNDPIDKRIADMTKFFKNVADAFNVGKDGKSPIYSTETLLAMKLIKTAKTSQKGKTYFTLDMSNYVGKGQFDTPIIKEGKIITVLEFTSNETVDLTAPTATTAVAGVGQGEQMDAGVAKSLGLE